MEMLTTGTLAGAGSFRCDHCGYVVTLSGAETLPSCPGCSANAFVRASLFAAGRFQGSRPTESAAEDGTTVAAAARDQLDAPGTYLAFRDGEELRTVPLDRDWTRIGRSLAAEVRLDDPTVSRRHALIVKQADGLRVVDDRSLNGVFVNGERVEWRMLQDGDELVVGRYRLIVVEHAADRSAAPG